MVAGARPLDDLEVTRDHRAVEGADAGAEHQVGGDAPDVVEANQGWPDMGGLVRAGDAAAGIAEARRAIAEGEGPTNDYTAVLVRGVVEHQAEIDELLSNWRYRHFMMVRRMIGIRTGTGGTSGAGYLEGTLSQHYAFREITEVATFLIERSKRPVLPNALKEKVSFNV